MTALFPFTPNWRDSYRVTYEFKTEILTSRSGREQRRALRQTPRKSISYTVQASKARLVAFERLMASSQDKKLLLPEIPRGVSIFAEMPIAGRTVTVSSVPNWLVQDATVVLVKGQQAATRVVSSVVGSVVTFSAISPEVWPTGTLVCPALTGLVSGDMAARFKTSAAMEADCAFNVDPGSEDPDEGVAGTLQLDGYEVFPFRANWTSDLEGSYQHGTEAIDYGFGVTANFSPIPFATQIRQPNFVGKTAAEITAIRQFFARMHGQQGEFFYSTEQADLTLGATTEIGGSTLVVPGTDTYDAYHTDTVHKAILVEMLDGTRYARKLNSITSIGGNTVITIEGTAPKAWNTTTVRSISWLLRCRFASDQLSLEFLTESVAQTKLSIQTLEALD